MKIDFSQPITAYELLAIILAALAIVIPILKWIYDKWIKKLVLSFLPSGTITVCHNKSGSYVSFGGVYEAKNKPAIIKEISANIIRKNDSATLLLVWSTFSSPVYKKVAGNYESSFETAHPFKVEADTLEPTFIEFSNRKENMNEKIDAILKPTYDAARFILSTPNIELIPADNKVKSSPEAQAARIALNDDFFWKKGTYKLELVSKYNNTEMCNTYYFSLSSEESEKLRQNIESMLVIPVADHFRLTVPFNTVRKDYSEDEIE